MRRKFLREVAALGLLLGPAAGWDAADDDSFEVSLSDRGRTVRARVRVDERGAPTDFETTDRFLADAADPSKVVRCRWTTPVEGWRDVGGRRLPTGGRAIWHPEGAPEFAYAELRFLPETLAFNVAPGG